MIQFVDYLVVTHLRGTHSMASVTLKVGARGSVKQGGSGVYKDINTKHSIPLNSGDKKRREQLTAACMR